MAASEAFTMQQAKEALRDGKLMGWKCTTCGHTQATPMLVCPVDRKRAIEGVELPPTGQVVSFTVQNVSSEEYINDIPFAFVVVELDNKVRVSGWLPYVAKAADLPLGTKVRFTPSYKPGVQFEKA
ncbi:MAG TPA: OB-fold domain-containing protein [Candidatus Thermoplasmatota archaeon]|nr:OB-fold domain-containing protein [Candidatus Thermoplasmatota archaeon]